MEKLLEPVKNVCQNVGIIGYKYNAVAQNHALNDAVDRRVIEVFEYEVNRGTGVFDQLSVLINARVA